jgi:hypothetical protein
MTAPRLIPASVSSRALTAPAADVLDAFRSTLVLLVVLLLIVDITAMGVT